MRCFAYLGSGLLLIIFLLPLRAGASLYSSYSWQELTLRADFIGVVECVTAGEIVARYRVIDSWKGETNGNIITIRMATGYWDGWLDAALVGERYLVAGFNDFAPAVLVSDTAGGSVPLWWRQLPINYYLSKSGSMDRLPPEPDDKGKVRLLNMGWQSLEECRNTVCAFIPADPNDYEISLLKYLITRRLSSRPKDTPEYVAAQTALVNRVQNAKSVSETIAILLDLAHNDPTTWKSTLPSMLASCDQQTLQVLDALPVEQWPYEENQLTDIREALKSNIHPPTDEGTLTQPTPEQLKRMRSILVGKIEEDETEDFGTVLTTLTLYEPNTVVDYLINWRAGYPAEERQGYVLASWFALKCTQDRLQHFKALLKARDPYIRVTGAVYLCFEDEKAGMAALKQLSSLKGNLGIWAAFTRLRRGDKSAMPRALQALVEIEDSIDDRLFLDVRLMVLLSNTAQASNIPAPPALQVLDPYSDNAKARQNQESIRSWWNRYQDRIILTDPWLQELSRQKCD